MDLAQMQAAVTMEGVLSGTAALELIAEVERLGGIVTALEEGCHKCQHPVRVRELTCQKTALQQVVAERDAEISHLTALCDGYRGEVEAAKVKLDSCVADEEKTRAYWSSAYYRMESKCEELQTALTRARAEALEEAAEAAYPILLHHLPPHKAQCVTAAIRARATKGESDEG